MKSLFYGGAVAALSGLLLGAGLKAPLAAEDFEPMAEIVGFESAEAATYSSTPQYATPAYYAPAVELRPTPAAYEEAEAAPTPAVYTVDEGEDAPAAAVYELAAAEPVEASTNIIRSAPAEEPAVAGRSQGFELVETPAAGPS